MHILVAALLALSCFIPVFGSVASGAANLGDNAAQSERTTPDFDDRDDDSSYFGDRFRSDRPDGGNGLNGQDSQNGQNDGTDQNGQNGSDVGGQDNGQTTPDGSTQNGDRNSAKRFNPAPYGQNGTTMPDDSAAPNGAVTPDTNQTTPNSSVAFA